ncbi:hypothetical protein Aconfl_03020 [Algoriphagus confluentis]|uniref:Uncharacterized protein n=1 Tax=Algoriphagus confluentis TaxID=1697556 RepID=A0ABQ6PK89_9BACT|nr:hypothetical protein Aconfl_03020 [Algoriphagus confluentis]
MGEEQGVFGLKMTEEALLFCIGYVLYFIFYVYPLGCHRLKWPRHFDKLID